MRRLCSMVILLSLAGCQNVRGPFDPKSPARVDDPRLPIFEQERRGRDRFALPDESPMVAPLGGASRPGQIDRR